MLDLDIYQMIQINQIWKKIITTYISTNMSSSMLALFWKKANFFSDCRIDKYLNNTKMFVIARRTQWNLVNLREFAD